MALVTLVELKDRLGITTSDDDLFLQAEIDYISDVVSNYCGRNFEQASYTQTIYRDESGLIDSFYLYHFPVSAISEIRVDSTVWAVDNYRFNKKTGKIKFNYHVNYNEIEIDFTAGYLVSDVPLIVKNVVYSIVEERYNKKKSGVALNFGSDVQRISVAGVMSIDFDYTLENNERAKRYGMVIGNYSNMLDPYRSERVVIGNLVYSNVE